MRRVVLLLIVAVLSSQTDIGNKLLADQVINLEGSTYDSQPAAVSTHDGATWIAWHAYRNGKDDVLVRRVGPDQELGEPVRLSDSRRTHSPPVVVESGRGVWVIWSVYEGDRWSVIGRSFDGATWQPAKELSDDIGGVYPAAASLPDNRLIVAWSAISVENTARIRCRILEGAVWQDAFDVCSGDSHAYRPAIASDTQGNAWIFWDEYDGQHYAVQARQIRPTLGAIERVSPVDEHCLTPTAMFTGEGLTVAWLQKVDVIGGPGVISQWHTLHAAVRTSSGWRVVLNQQGSSVAAELTQGLMAKIHPQPIPTGGYLGRRTAPMLAEVHGKTWLMWERKSDHKDATWRVVGDLLGRRIDDGRWSNAVTLNTGRVDYHTIEPAKSMSSNLPMLASQLPRQERRLYHRMAVDLSKAQAYQQDRWDGWAPIQLPVQTELNRPHQIQVGDQTYHLYWADLHCHSGLTADAEGEPDELFHYARDRARLDVVVFTNNDFIYDVPLTQYEYAMSNFLARVHGREDFVALPGYEWTSRVPGTLTATVADPGNWTQPYRNESFPNHRSVIFSSSGGPLVHFTEVANDISQLYSAVARVGGVAFTQHEAFQTTGNAVEVGMELTSGWRRYIARRPNLFHDPLQKGLRMGFMASGDTHRRAPGLSGALTGIYAKELTGDAVLEALRERRYFATSGSRVIVDSRANGAMMGTDTLAVGGQVTLTVEVVGTKPIGRAVLVSNGVDVQTFDGDGTNRLSATHVETRLARGVHWYYWRVEQDPATPDLPGNLNPAFGHLAWSSPHWVKVD